METDLAKDCRQATTDWDRKPERKRMSDLPLSGAKMIRVAQMLGNERIRYTLAAAGVLICSCIGSLDFSPASFVGTSTRPASR